MSRPETKLWFFFLAASYIDLGVEAIHFGQTELMNGNDRDLRHYAEVLALIRSYAGGHARRHMLICDSHVPSGGLVRDGKLLMDFHSFPLRIKEVPDKPEEAELKVGHTDAIYGRSKGGVTPSGWACEHLPYLQMPGSRTVRSPLDGRRWYFANAPSAAVPTGLGDEDAIQAVWAIDAGGR